MAMTNDWKNAVLDVGSSLITRVGLLDESGVELSGGSYARQAISWEAASEGAIVPTGDVTFDVPSGSVVSKVAYYSTGGDKLGEDEVTNETFAEEGQYKLRAVWVSISLIDPT